LFVCLFVCLMKKYIIIIVVICLGVNFQSCQKESKDLATELMEGSGSDEISSDPPPISIEIESAVACAEAAASFVLTLNNSDQITQCALLALINDVNLSSIEKDSILLNDPTYTVILDEASTFYSVLLANYATLYFSNQVFQHTFEDIMMFEMGYENIPEILRENVGPCDAWAAGNRSCALNLLACSAFGGFHPLVMIGCGILLWDCVDTNDKAYPDCVPTSTSPAEGTAFRDPTLCQ
jgi:hypothetical protein